MSRGKTLRAALVAFSLAGFACATQPTFTFYPDDAGDASAPTLDAHAAIDGSTDATLVNDSSLSGDDAGVDGEALDGDMGSLDAEADGEVDGALLDAGDGGTASGCGSLDIVTNCGACGVACDTSHSNGRACAITADAASCTYTSCATGFADCDAAPPNANGCDTNIMTVTNCGACGASCNTANSVDSGCGTTGCTYACAPGWGNCDPVPPNTSGCSTNITTATNCGACGVSCNTANSVDAGCGATGCTYACAPGWSNCDTTATLANTAGCACNTPACCASPGAAPGGGGAGYGCETTHANGVGQSFYDCAALDTYSEPEATAACNAYLATVSTTGACTGIECTSVHGAITYAAVGYFNSSLVGYVWVYGGTTNGTTAGTVYPASTFCGTHPGGESWQ